MDPIIDDLSTAPHRASNGAAWQLVSDRVMGGVSSGSLSVENIADRKALRLRGQVSLENNGGFLQLALDLAADGSPVDASAWAGLEVDVYGLPEGCRFQNRCSHATEQCKSTPEQTIIASDHKVACWHWQAVANQGAEV